MARADLTGGVLLDSDAAPDKLAQAACCGIREVAQANPSHRIPVQFRGNRPRAHVGQLPCADTRLGSAQIRPVQFHCALKACAVEPGHRGAQLQ